MEFKCLLPRLSVVSYQLVNGISMVGSTPLPSSAFSLQFGQIRIAGDGMSSLLVAATLVLVIMVFFAKYFLMAFRPKR